MLPGINTHAQKSSHCSKLLSIFEQNAINNCGPVLHFILKLNYHTDNIFHNVSFPKSEASNFLQQIFLTTAISTLTIYIR